MTLLSVNINKIATLRNARGGNNPNVLQTALNIEKFGAQGITVHPRPDQRHIRFTDVSELSKNISTEFNIEGYPTQAFIELVINNKPTQVTLVPDPPEVLTSNSGWDLKNNMEFLTNIIAQFKAHNIRTSIFMDPLPEQIELCHKTNTDRIELYTEEYATVFQIDKNKAIAPYILSAKMIQEQNIGLNAGHDLDLNNLAFFKQSIPNLQEVSIGHALVCDALYLGLDNTVKLYLKALQ